MRPYLLAVRKIHFAPAQNRNLFAGSADFHGFALGVYAVAFVDIVDATSKPDTAIAIIHFNSVDCFSWRMTFHTFGGDLPPGFVGDGLACLQSQAIIFSQLNNTSNINHFLFSLLFFHPAR